MEALLEAVLEALLEALCFEVALVLFEAVVVLVVAVLVLLGAVACCEKRGEESRGLEGGETLWVGVLVELREAWGRLC